MNEGGDWWLTECMKRLEKYGASLDDIAEYARSWELAAVRYGSWLCDEGFDFDDAVSIVLQAIKKTDFDLSQFPVCS